MSGQHVENVRALHVRRDLQIVKIVEHTSFELATNVVLLEKRLGVVALALQFDLVSVGVSKSYRWRCRW